MEGQEVTPYLWDTKTKNTSPLQKPTPMRTATKGQLINRILTTAKASATATNHDAHFQANAAGSFISLAFKSERELRTLCKKIGC